MGAAKCYVMVYSSLIQSKDEPMISNDSFSTHMTIEYRAVALSMVSCGKTLQSLR